MTDVGLTREQVEELARLASKVELPWVFTDMGIHHPTEPTGLTRLVVGHTSWQDGMVDCESVIDQNDGDYLTAAANLAPALCRSWLALEAEHAKLRGQVEAAMARAADSKGTLMYALTNLMTDLASALATRPAEEPR